MRRPAGLIVCLLFTAAIPAAALSFTVVGGWSLEINETNLSGTAGSDFTATSTSVANAAVVNVADAVDQFEAWYIDINKTDVAWDSSLTLSSIRTSDGIGLGTISGGTVLLEITDTAQRFFQGTGNRSSIQTQFQVDGLSVTLGVQALSVTIVYTLLDAP